jgi:hypothetical protein
MKVTLKLFCLQKGVRLDILLCWHERREMTHKKILLVFALGLAVHVSAQPAATGSDSPKSEEFEFPTVAVALTAIKARWDLERFSRDDGWLGFSDSRNKVIWTFAPAGHPAYPAVIKRAIIDDGKVVTVRTTAKCEGPKVACDQLLLEFKALDGNADEYLKFQNRNSSVNILKGTAPAQPVSK